MLKLGLVLVASGGDGAHPQGHELQASFAEAVGTFSAQTIGPCELITTTQTGSPTALDAGTLSVTGGLQKLTASPDAQKHYPDLYDHQTNLWSGGETLTIAASGGDIAAFKADFVAASYVDLVAPAEPAKGAPLSLSRTKDLAFQWSGGVAGKVTVVFEPSQSTMLICSFPAKDGQGTVPASALAQLPPKGLGGFGVLGGELRWMNTGDAEILFQVSSALTWNGVPNPQTFTYQALD